MKVGGAVKESSEPPPPRREEVQVSCVSSSNTSINAWLVVLIGSETTSTKEIRSGETASLSM